LIERQMHGESNKKPLQLTNSADFPPIPAPIGHPLAELKKLSTPPQKTCNKCPNSGI